MTVGSYEFADGTSGRFTLDDLRSNSLSVMVAAVAVLALGVGLVLGGRRIGAGLAGGAAVAVTSMATMDAALVVAQLHEARRVGLATGVATITWEPGFYVVIAAGVLGLVAAAEALTAWREAGPAVPAVAAALGAIAVVVTVVGALVPTGGRTWADNLAIPGFGTLPSWLRLGALALVGVAGTLGFASRKRWATAVAVGAIAALAAQRIGAVSPPTPNRRGGPGLAITPLVDAAQTVHTTGLVAVVVLALVGWLVAERRACTECRRRRRRWSATWIWPPPPTSPAATVAPSSRRCVATGARSCPT